MQPGQLIVFALGIVVVAPLAGAVLAFTPDASLRKIGRFILAAAWLFSAAGVGACIWLSMGESSGIGNDVFLLIAIVPALIGFICFAVWRAARRHDYVQSLPPERRRVEELSDIEEGIELTRRELRDKEKRAASFFTSSKERERLRNEIPILKLTLARLEAERAKRTAR